MFGNKDFLRAFAIDFRYKDIFIAHDEDEVKDKFQEYLQTMRYGELIENLTIIELDENGNPLKKDV